MKGFIGFIVLCFVSGCAAESPESFEDVQLFMQKRLIDDGGGRHFANTSESVTEDVPSVVEM